MSKSIESLLCFIQMLKTMNHIILGTWKEGIPIHNFTSSTIFSTPNLFNARNRMLILQLCKKWNHIMDLLLIDDIMITINHNKHWSMVINLHLMNLG
jgi:hypothetical protein